MSGFKSSTSVTVTEVCGYGGEYLGSAQGAQFLKQVSEF